MGKKLKNIPEFYQPSDTFTFDSDSDSDYLTCTIYICDVPNRDFYVHVFIAHSILRPPNKPNQRKREIHCTNNETVKIRC